MSTTFSERELRSATPALPEERALRRMGVLESALRIAGGAQRRLRGIRLRLRGVSMGRRCWIQEIEVPRNPWDIKLGDGVALDRGVVLLATGDATGSPRIAIGDGCYVNRSTMFDASERIEVGAGCMIGPFCYITDHDHAMEAGVPVAEQPLVSAAVRIGRDVWLGAGVKVLNGVTIGDGAVVGAGAVVTKDVPAGAVAVGVPARVVGRRE